MSKKIKIILVIIITLIVGLAGYSQVLPVIVENPKEDFVPISIDEANNTQDSNMTLSFLYNITKEKHPTGSKEIYKVRDYIVECLEQMEVQYKVNTQELNDEFFLDVKARTREEFIRVKNNQYNYIKENIKDGNVEKFIKEQGEYDSFDEFFNEIALEGRDIEYVIEEYYKKYVEKYQNQTLNNIVAKINLNNNPNAKNIMFVAHYDSGEQSYGAGDDGVAVAGLLETIRCLKETNFNNNVYVMFTDGEEQGFWGAYEFIEKNNINFDLIVNFDNCGNSGNLILYHYSSDSLTKEYFKAVNKESSYSFANDLLYNPNSEYFKGECSDAFVFVENGYNTIDLALVGNPFNYHTEKDNFYNTEIKSLNNLTKSMIEMMNYFGNNNIELDRNEKLVNFKLLNGVVFSVNKSIYIISSIISIAMCCIYIVILFVKKKKIIYKILVISLTIVSIITLCLFENFSLLFSIPCFIMFVLNFIKNKKIREVTKIILFECYLFIVIQLIIPFIQYIIWLNL